MTEEYLAFPAIPCCLVSLLLVFMTVVAAVDSLCPSHWEVFLTEPLHGRLNRWTSDPLPAAVHRNKLLCKAYSELLEVVHSQVCVVFAQYVAVGDSQIKYKPKDAFVIFPALQPDVVISRVDHSSPLLP